MPIVASLVICQASSHSLQTGTGTQQDKRADLESILSLYFDVIFPLLFTCSSLLTALFLILEITQSRSFM